MVKMDLIENGKKKNTEKWKPPASQMGLSQSYLHKILSNAFISVWVPSKEWKMEGALQH